MIRRSHPSLKQAKKKLASGDTTAAMTELLASRDQKLMLVKHGHASPETREGLSKIDTLLGECHSLNGDEQEANKWFQTAHEFLEPDANEMLGARLLRQEAMHHLRFGHWAKAMTELANAGMTMERLIVMDDSLPLLRRETELAFTRVCQSEVLLYANPCDQRALLRLVEVYPTLRQGNKRRYELACLLLLIKHGNMFDVWRTGYLIRATYLNRRYVHNAQNDLFLLNASLGPLAVKTFARSAFQASR
jgi:hypothetical protein